MSSDIIEKNLSVTRLLRGEINDSLDDNLFWYASRVLINHDSVDVYVDDNNLTVSDEVPLELNKISYLATLKQDNLLNMKNVLISSGSFLFINEKLAITQRQLTTRFDPGFWTTPAGRCDRTIFQTAIKETIEEIAITQHNHKLFPDIAKTFIEDSENEQFYEVSFEDSQFPLKTYKVTLYLDNNPIEQCTAWMHYAEHVNTIEFRIPLFAKLDETNLQFSNPEFWTPTDLKTIEQLSHLQTVPALNQLLKEINNVK